MADKLAAVLMVVGLFAVPLAFRMWLDRIEAKGLEVRAEVDEALRHALGGESLIAISVVPATRWRTGRVVLSAPTGCGAQIQTAWNGVMSRVPTCYELVVRPGNDLIPCPQAA